MLEHCSPVVYIGAHAEGGCRQYMLLSLGCLLLDAIYYAHCRLDACNPQGTLQALSWLAVRCERERVCAFFVLVTAFHATHAH